MSKMIALTLYINRLILQYLNCSFLKETVELQRNTQRDLIVNYCPQIGTVEIPQFTCLTTYFSLKMRQNLLRSRIIE